MSGGSNKLNTEEFIQRSKARYGDKFSYEKTIYTGAFDKLIVTCSTHGDILTSYQNHMKGYGCRECGKVPNTNKQLEAALNFKQKAQEILGDNYDLSLSVYVSSKVKLEVICKLHGAFDMTPSSILAGQRCPVCSRKSQADSHRMSLNEFIGRCAKYDGKYDYSRFNYVSNNTKGEIICPIHGVFEQTPAGHLSGGCNKCAQAKSGEVKTLRRSITFVEDVIKVHGDTYILDKTKFIGSKYSVIVTCRDHGDFAIKPHSLLVGCGCTSCAKFGYRHNLPGKIYVLASKDITKIGITNNAAIDRAVRISKSSKEHFDVVFSAEFDNGKIPQDIETKILKEFKLKYRQPDKKFAGYTECFYSLPSDVAVSRITELISQHQ